MKSKANKNNDKGKPTVLSMFSGCGGFDLGFIRAGYKVVWANDIDHDACVTYRKNIGEINEGDIDRITIIPKFDDLDVLTAGFPCQPFSNAGQRRSVKDDRGTLFNYCFKFIDKLNPKFVLFENVRGFLSIKGHDKRVCEEVMDHLCDRGYRVYINLINASDYGVPQNRLRVFIVGHREDIPAYAFPQKVIGKDLSLQSLLAVPGGTANQDHLQPLNPQAIAIGKMVPEGGSWKSIPYDKLPARMQRIHDNIRRYRWPNFFRRYRRDEISGTITAAFKPENAAVWHPWEDRVLSAREVARIQSFPDDFVFHADSVKSIYAMIGNAVPPLLAEAFAKSILDAINGKVTIADHLDYFEVRRLGKPIRPGGLGMEYGPQHKESILDIQYPGVEKTCSYMKD